MLSDIPKVLHSFHGRTLIGRALDVAMGACDRVTVVVGFRGDQVRSVLPAVVDVAFQGEQLGTGHAVACALDTFVGDEDSVLVMPGDHPLMSIGTLVRLVESRRKADAAAVLAVVRVPNYDGVYAQFENCGRVVRDSAGEIAGIVEYKDAGTEQRKITEVNISSYCFRGDWLRGNIQKLAAENKAGEYYLTDLIGLAKRAGERVVGIELADFREGIGVNTVQQLLAAERL
jgi:bifunctional UDP-N-acetylglucosamine pyrophosphorylase/glucosamine-1-phosphate N-acetyltransferase